MRTTARFAPFAAAFLLSACTTLVPTGNAPVPRALDTIQDDLTGLILAFDVPAAVQPVLAQSRLRVEITPQGGAVERIEAGLQLADADLAEGALPPPQGGRTYYLLTLVEKDRAALKAAQERLRRLPSGTAVVSVGLAPWFCAIGADPGPNARYTVRVLASGQAQPLAPLVSNQPVAPSGQPLPAC